MESSRTLLIPRELREPITTTGIGLLTSHNGKTATWADLVFWTVTICGADFIEIKTHDGFGAVFTGFIMGELAILPTKLMILDCLSFSMDGKDN